jgi:RNA polymerase sigma factor (TIGR02999 family)
MTMPAGDSVVSNPRTRTAEVPQVSEPSITIDFPVVGPDEPGDPSAAEQLLPLVYDELRRLAARTLAQEKPGQTLQATALVHEVYVRLTGARHRRWESRGQFVAAAARAMRRVLIDRAREKHAAKRGSGRARLDIDAVGLATRATPDQLLAIDDALATLAREDPAAARIVELRYFAGLTVEEAGNTLGISTATAYRHWKYARAWLHSELLLGASP